MQGVKHTFKTIGAVICCILSLAVIALFIYAVRMTPAADEPELYLISKHTVLNGVYRFLTNGIDYNPLLMIVGLIALAAEILFSSPLQFLFRQLPLGRALEAEKQMTVKERLIPAILIGIASAVDNTYEALSPESFEKNAEWINWVLLIIIAISMLVQVLSLFSRGGIWRCLVSGALLIITNLGIGLMLGSFVSALCLLLAGLAIAFGGLLFALLIFCLLSVGTS